MSRDMNIKETPKYEDLSVTYAIPTFDRGMAGCRDGKIWFNRLFPPADAPAGFYVRHHDSHTHQTHVLGIYQSFAAAWAANAGSDSFTKAVLEKAHDGTFHYAKSTKIDREGSGDGD